MRKITRILLLLTVLGMFGCILFDPSGGGGEIITGTDQTAPQPGNGGIIAAYDNQSNSVIFYWSPATDDVTAQGSLQYQLRLSFEDNISNLSDAEMNGTVIHYEWNTALTNIKLINLTGGVTYYFNVIVRDASGKKSLYRRIALTAGSILINYNPVPGNDGLIDFSNLSSNHVDLNWSAAWDDNTEITNLEYKVVYSLEDNITTLDDAKNNGQTLSDWSEGKTNLGVTLNQQNTFYFNVLVRDEEGLEAVYDPILIVPSASGDNVPQPGYDGTVYTYDLTTSSVKLYWYSAEDDLTAESALEYKVVYSLSDNISSVAEIQSNGSALGTEWVSARTNLDVDSRDDDTDYYFNVLVRDGSGNLAAYESQTVRTLAVTAAPEPGGSGYIYADNLTTNSVDIYWVPATDAVTAQASLEYKLIYSTSDNIDTLSDATNNGVQLVDWTANYTNEHIYSLTSDYTYYFNVLVRDGDGNLAVYQAKRINVLEVSGFDYAGYTFRGMGDITDSSSPKNNNNYPSLVITKPSSRGFEADGYFTLEGNNGYTGAYQYALVKVTKDGTSESTSYWVRGNFSQRIWLRFGAGDYTVTVHYTRVTADLDYEGWISSWTYWSPSYTFNVNNTGSVDGSYLFPSAFIQSDDSEIMSLAATLTSGLTTTYDKVKACHDFVVTNLYYDDDSLVDDQRKKQDALTTLDNGTAVCEGYSTLFVALVRSLGIKAQYLTGYGGTEYHAWSSVSNASVWKLVDTTWDDPGPADNDPGNIRWTYFWKDSFADHSGTEYHPERSGDTKNIPEVNPYYFIGYPYGEY